MINDEIRSTLFSLQDKKYRNFQSGLIPTVAKEKIIGVRTPELRKLAKQLLSREDMYDYLNALPHEYFDENQLHAFIISEFKDFEECISAVSTFLPYIDNWATCDQLSPKIFKKYKTELLPYILKWINDDQTYTVRFAVKLLMENFLDNDFSIKYPKIVSAIRSQEYYINMMVAWYFATALAKQYDEALPFIENKCLDKWTHNKAIQKAVESFRITPEQKEYLKTLKMK